MKKRMVNLMGEYLAAGLYDVPNNEKWLADKARDGWLATQMNSKGRVEFADSEPNDTVRYRLRPAMRREKRPSAEEIELNEAFGWKYLGTAQKCLHLWRCDDPAAPELDTDPEVQAESFRYLIRRNIRECVLGLIGEILLLLVLLVPLCYGPLTVMVWRWHMGYLTLLSAYVILAPIGVVLETVTLIRRVRQLRTGVSPQGKYINYRMKRRFQMLLTTFYVLCILWPVLPGSFRHATAEDAIYPSVGTLEGTPDRGEAGMYDVRTKRLEVAPRIWLTRQFGENKAQLETEYYRMLTQSLAEHMENDLVEKSEWEKSNKTEMTQLSSEGLDSFWWMRCPDGAQYVVARLGNCVLRLHYYNGEADLRDHGPLYAETLKAK